MNSAEAVTASRKRNKGEWKMKEKQKNKNTFHIFTLIAAFCWAMAILSAFVAFNEYKSLEKTKAFVRAYQQSKTVNTENNNTASRYNLSAAADGETQTEKNPQPNLPVFDNETQTASEFINGQTAVKTYVINKNSKKIHSPDCQYADSMKEENKLVIETDNLEEYFGKGYTICSKCKAQ